MAACGANLFLGSIMIMSQASLGILEKALHHIAGAGRSATISFASYLLLNAKQANIDV